MEKEANRGPLVKVRYIQVALLTFIMLNLFMIRTCLSVAIVAMTSNNTSSNSNVPTYNWDNTNIILSTFYWSYAILQFVAGHLSHLFGTKWLLFSSMFMNSLASVLIPVAAQYIGAYGVIMCSLVQGLFQGFFLPCMNAMLGRWIPPREISLVNSLVYAGCALGIILSMVITGYLSASDWGWPAAFYAFGIWGFLWCILWVILSSESPALHGSISVIERKCIETSLSQQDDHLIDKKTIPWKAIFTSLPYWAIIMAAIGESWGTTFLSSELPSYFSYAVGLDIKDSSIFSALPTVGALIVGLCCGPIAALTINKGCISTVNSRRIFHGFGMFSLAFGLVILPYIEDKITAVGLLTASVSAASVVVLGHLVNQIDISPRYAGVLFGISNGTGQLVAIFAPVLAHFVIPDATNKRQWRTMFILSGAIATFTAIFFIIFCSGERQWWDDVDQDKLRSKKGHGCSLDSKTNRINNV